MWRSENWRRLACPCSTDNEEDTVLAWLCSVTWEPRLAPVRLVAARCDWDSGWRVTRRELHIKRKPQTVNVLPMAFHGVSARGGMH